MFIPVNYSRVFIPVNFNARAAAELLPDVTSVTVDGKVKGVGKFRRLNERHERFRYPPGLFWLPLVGNGGMLA